MVVVDLSQPRIDAWNSDELPIYEPGLDEVSTVDLSGAGRSRAWCGQPVKMHHVRTSTRGSDGLPHTQISNRSDGVLATTQRSSDPNRVL